MTRSTSVLVLLALACVTVLTACCPVETRLEPGPLPPQPIWVSRPPESSNGMMYFVGIAVVDNVLEERQGRTMAVQAAAAEVARNIAQAVHTYLLSAESRIGPVQKGEDRLRTHIDDEALSRSGAIITELSPVQYYQERWFVRETYGGKSFRRYKHYVLCAFPEEEFQSMALRIRYEASRRHRLWTTIY